MDARSREPQRGARRALTLVELLVTIAIISILASIFLGALLSATEEARRMKTKSMITKLNNLIMPLYEAYRTRRVPINISVTGTGASAIVVPAGSTLMGAASQMRLNALHELMRFEMPEAWTDITDTPIYLLNRPALNQAYLNAYQAVPNATIPPPATGPIPLYENAETLYMIVTLGFVDELGGRDLFNESSVGDTDQDGFPEFLDAWGTPIRFLRWAPGFTASELNGAGGQVHLSSGSSIIVMDIVATPSAPYSYGMSKLNNAYAGKQIRTYSLNGGTPVVQSATITSSACNTPSPGQTTLILSTTLATPPQPGDFFGIDPDPFNPLNLNPNQSPASAVSAKVAFANFPLIYSAGPDKVYSVVSENGLTNTSTYPFCATDPFWSIGNPNYQYGPVGWTADLPSESGTSGWSSNMSGWLDNIHNHAIAAR